MAPQTRKRLLLLGGTGEALALAEELQKSFASRIETITSLAGRTRHPARVPGAVRLGGFGGVEGLVRLLRDERITAVVDATHPFAAQMSRHARLAAEAVKLPRLRLTRPPWQQHPQDNWIIVKDIHEAVAAVAGLAEKKPRSRLKVFLTIGPQDANPFLKITETDFILRQIDPQETAMPSNVHIIIGRGPFTFENEVEVLTQQGVQVLVTKASGGAATYAKIAAARQRQIPVIMIARPDPEPGETVTEVAAALRWLAEKLTAEPV